MTEVETAIVRPPEPVTISIVSARNLRGQKGDAVSVVIKAEFGEKVLGESPKIDSSADEPAEVNFNAILNCAYDDPHALDEIAYKPVVLTVIEVLPKEKRQKEEKTHLLGQCTVDLLPLVRGETKVSYTLLVNAVPGSPLESLPAECPQPEIDVNISVQEPLLVDKHLKNGNLIKITMENLLSPPETWTLSGTQYHYAAALPIPVTEDKEAPIVFANGQLKPGSDKELPNKQKKWSKPGNAQGNAVYIPDSFVVSEPIEDEDGDLKGKDDREFRLIAETEKNRVSWTTERRCFLDSAATKHLQDEIAKNRLWPVEVMRLAQASGGKGKKEEEGGINFHGIAFVNLAPLLYPGVKKIRGAYKVWPYSDHILQEKTKRKGGISDEASKIAMNILQHNSTSPSPKKGAKEPEKKDVKKGTSQTVKSDTGSELDGQPPVNAEGQMYVEAKSFVMLEIALDRPLIPKRQPEELARKVAEYIPQRPQFPKRTDGAQRSVEDYHGQVASVANLILDEFRGTFGNEETSGELNSNEDMETKRQKLIYELNSSGKYFAFKEQLKHSVVKIVREKYLKTTNFDDRQELQTFLSELYVYLVDQMHLALGDTLDVGDQSPVPEPLTDSNQLKHFAKEAEVNENYELASKYYQERIAREKNNADNWYDYGTFNLHINDITKAEECFKECISINQKHLYGLMMYGVVCSLLDRKEEAETFFEAATNIDPKSIRAWTMLGLFYDSIGNDIGAEMAYMEANKLNHSAAVAAAKVAKTDTKEKTNLTPPGLDNEPSKDSEVLGDCGLSVPHIDIKSASTHDRTALTSAKSSHRSIDRRGSSTKKSDKIPSASNKAKGQEHTTGALSISRPASQQKAASMMGTPQPLDDTIEDIPPREPTPLPTCSIYMQTIEWLLEAKAVPFAERALAHELLLPGNGHGGPSIDYQIALAQLNLQKRCFSEAEKCLKIALEMEQQNPDGWALMGHVKYLTGDTETARECFERTISFIGDALEMHSIYLRLASIYLSEHKYQDAKNVFLMACRKSPSCVSWLGVGIACYRLNELLEAEDALSEANILNNSDAEVWGYLSLVCLKCGRQLEAEQTYKYALKLNLQDKALINEIYEVQQEVGFGNPQF
ncbi:cilia- and flagella-associated protein 70 [Patella vulgata]|uniref:cilia- and flagella-associated protein 70 n=1 Tax=Patella vulgata TaxID=6465 RepID=UPI00217F28B3|nr:cilia- and flagella-associated protein 70 [Patella vulgata]